MEMPWYKDGLRFECTQCGNCCTGAPGFVWVNRGEIAALAKLLGMTVADFEAKYVRKVGNRNSLIEYANGDCVFWDREAGCTIYPVRPPQCRTWPFWESHVPTSQAWNELRQVCPGAGQGELISAEEIARIDGPAGIPIGAATPAEIALSVLAGATAALRRP